MTLLQIFTWLAAGALIAIVAYIFIQYLLQFLVGNRMASRLVGDGTSTASIQLNDIVPTVTIDEENYSSGYISD